MPTEPVAFEETVGDVVVPNGFVTLYNGVTITYAANVEIVAMYNNFLNILLSSFLYYVSSIATYENAKWKKHRIIKKSVIL